jgi:acyl-coenzyme A thioesterase PaaI-like protein
MAASWSTTTAPENMRGTTVGLTVQFLAAARSANLTARATVIRRGKSLCNVEVDITTADGELVAKGLVTYKLG